MTSARAHKFRLKQITVRAGYTGQTRFVNGASGRGLNFNNKQCYRILHLVKKRTKMRWWCPGVALGRHPQLLYGETF